jgi:hypothetical protein
MLMFQKARVLASHHGGPGLIPSRDRKFFNFYLCLWVIFFALLGPDTDMDLGTPLNPDPFRIRIRIHNTAYMLCLRPRLQAEEDESHGVLRLLGEVQMPRTGGRPSGRTLRAPLPDHCGNRYPGDFFFKVWWQDATLFVYYFSYFMT